MTQVIRVGQHLPPGMATLAEAAALEGVRNVGKLIAAWEQWESGEELPGKVLANLKTAGLPEVLRQLSESGWETGEQRFDRDGAALFAAFVGNHLAGIGGVKREADADESAMRMHRFYVHPMYRRQGVGRVLADAAMAQGIASAALLTCNARASAAAAVFWEALGFERRDAAGYTHIFRAGTKWPA